MLWILQLTFRRIVKRGNLTIEAASGKTFRFGDGEGIPIYARIVDRRAEWQFVLNPQLYLGEMYMDGRLTFEQGSIYDFLEVLLSNMETAAAPRWLFVFSALRYLARRVHQYNPARKARRNVAHHYDLDGALYDLFLDDDRQYSCAYFEQADASLDDAQLAKKRHLAAKLQLQDGQSVLDIGSGWGGLGLYLAGCADVHVTGITLSEEQLKISRERKIRQGYDTKIDYKLQDYRFLTQQFDRIISVGMFEHVGVSHYKTYFKQVRDLLHDDGVAVIHSIGRFDGPGVTNAWIDKYIFPGGYIPALSEVVPVVERLGLFITDIEILRLHYADTLRHWRQRFMANRDKASEIYDERFCRMWEFYLSASETSFRYEGMIVFQMQLAKKQQSLPMTRDYIYEWERERRQQDARVTTSQRLAGE